MAEKDCPSERAASSATQMWVQTLKDLAAAATALSAAAGIAFSSYTYVSTQWNKNDEARRSQLTTFSTYGQYLAKYQKEMQPALARLMKDPVREQLDIAMRHNAKTACQAVLNRSTTKTGFQVFMSDDLKDAREVHNFYESIGYGLSKEQLDFEVIFELITLPAYWNIQNPDSSWYDKSKDDLGQKDISRTFLYPDFSVLLPWRNCLGTGFYGKDKPLSDFSDGVDQLGYNYLFARMQYIYGRSCKEGEALAVNSFIDHPNGLGWTWSVLDDACKSLKRRIHAMAKADGSPKSWMKLYKSNTYDIDTELNIAGHPFQWPWWE
jgi:hypothetical protein